jgi:hypothetical protein
MKKILAIVVLLLLSANAQALEMAGVSVPETANIGNQVLELNGCGIRKKLFFSIYLGALYTPRHVSSLKECQQVPGDKLIRMTFLYKKVEKEKIVAAFAEGFEKNSPELAMSSEVRKFLSFFSEDFSSGDIVELELGGSGKTVVRYNGRVLGTLDSPALAPGVLAIYLGEHPADDDLKKGMLGLNR